MKSQAVLVKES